MENKDISKLVNVTVDVSHQNTVDFNTLSEDNIIKAIIHKATQSNNFVDPMYAERQKEATCLKFLWGAYHFGVGDVDPKDQVDFFLKTVGDPHKTLCALDFEPNTTTGVNMTIDQAGEFIELFQSKTGFYPGIYGGTWMIDQLGDKIYPTFQKCWLWQGYYEKTIKFPPNWKDWTLWQYTDGTEGMPPRTVNGITGKVVDRDIFNGTLDELKQFWTSRE